MNDFWELASACFDMLIGTPVSRLFKLSMRPSKVSSIVENLIYNWGIILGVPCIR